MVVRFETVVLPHKKTLWSNIIIKGINVLLYIPEKVCIGILLSTITLNGVYIKQKKQKKTSHDKKC